MTAPWPDRGCCLIRWIFRAAAVLAAVQLAACGNDASNVQVSGIQQGETPFISFVDLTGSDLKSLVRVGYFISPKSGTASAPVHVRYSLDALQRKGYVTGDATPKVRVPVFGLYAGYTNLVAFQFEFSNRAPDQRPVEIDTPTYTDPNALYDRPNVLKARSPGTSLEFDYFVIKSAYGSPVILDTDGAIRWVGPTVGNSQSSIVTGDGFLVGDNTKPVLHQVGLDGTLAENTLPDPTITRFHHNIDPGKQGVLAEINSVVGGTANIESILLELAPDGSILKQWDLAAILAAYMNANGDDASLFVRPGYDWFHMNAATYDPRDDTLIVSSRENFLIKLDYSTGNILWILGDPHKYWYTFPSLRAKALALQAGGNSPIGQHAVSITTDGLLMLFNDGLGSRNQPAGAPPGDDLLFSKVSAYSIDASNNLATEAWHFDYGQTIYSSICSSSYEPAPGAHSLLVDYAVADQITHARLVGLDEAHNVVFDYEYPTNGCNTAWNAKPIGLTDLEIN